ncbi:hypothetical protein KC960_01260 [Candidatus Saccharibacteria bacterium]|nr:hypothetical protein [Candidatus Saccharibacteria bacterium]
MILKLLLALIPVGIILLTSEYLWCKELIKGERARKFIHVLAGVWVAFWPYYLPFDGIFVLGCMMLALVIYSRFTNLFHAIYSVRRKTYGDIFYAIAIMACALWASSDWAFTIAILVLAVADGAAAVSGRLWAKKTYLVFGQSFLKKSYLGTFTFFAICYVSIIVGYLAGGGLIINQHILFYFLLLPLTLTILENIMPAGLDNVAIPLVAILLMNNFL